MPKSQLVDHLNELLDELVRNLGSRATLQTAREHAQVRWETGFDLPALVREYGILLTVLYEVVKEQDADVSLEEWHALTVTLWDSAVLAVRAYTEFREDRDAAQRRAIDVVRAELEGLYTAAPLGFALLDRELRFRMVNPILAAMNGIPIEAHIGKTPMELLPQVPAEFVVAHARRVLETGEAQRNVALEAETIGTQGVKRHFLEHWYPVRVNSEIIGIGIIVEDVTDRRRLEAARDRIVGIVSHDLRNPLTAILSACSHLLAKGPRPEIGRLAARIQRSASRMRSLVDQLFDYARLDQLGRLPLERRHFDLGELVQRVAEETELASRRTDVNLELELQGNLCGAWDESRIAQVLSNLMGNALQHGEGAVRVRALGCEREVVIEVANEGAPVAPEVAARMFEPFESAGAAREHLGLGLFITREIVRAHGGTIELRSGGRKTVFSAHLPRE